MPTTVSALACDNTAGQFYRTTIQRRDLSPTDVAFDIKFAGICHSDIHTVRGEWGPALYPLTPGHELAGVVTAVGGDVTKFKVGDAIGVGCFVDSCRQCPTCLSGQEQFCERGETVWTYNSLGKDGQPTAGGYSTAFVVDQDYACHIPANLPLDQAAPLLCAGITTFSPLKRFGAGPGKRVAVVGMGGLGHVGVQIAHAMGAEVSVISRTLSKRAESAQLGAAHHYSSEDPKTFEDLAGQFDLIVSTVSADIDLDAYLGLLKLGGIFCFVGMSPDAETLRPQTLEGGQYLLTGSMIGGIDLTQEMLDFCGEHNITAVVEVIDADQVTAAYDKVVAGQVHFRYVIDTATIPA